MTQNPPLKTTRLALRAEPIALAKARYPKGDSRLWTPSIKCEKLQLPLFSFPFYRHFSNICASLAALLRLTAAIARVALDAPFTVRNIHEASATQ